MNIKKTIYLATDHAGFEYKEQVKNILESNFSDEYTVVDCGAESYDPADDYPDFISLAAQKVSENPDTALGIIFGGSGQGEAMVANRYPNVRATVYYGAEKEILKLSKEHNNANILSIGARFVKEYDLEEVLSTWIHSKFSEEKRHQRRINKIEKLQIIDTHDFSPSFSDKVKSYKRFLGMK